MLFKWIIRHKLINRYSLKNFNECVYYKLSTSYKKKKKIVTTTMSLFEFKFLMMIFKNKGKDFKISYIIFNWYAIII